MRNLRLLVTRSITAATVATLCLLLLSDSVSAQNAFAVTAEDANEPVLIIDTHNHLNGRVPLRSGLGGSDYLGAAQAMLESMDEFGISKAILMPTPQTTDQRGRYTANELQVVVRRFPERFAFLAGGGTLNPMIQKAIEAGHVTESLRIQFEKAAVQAIADGAVGFGEMTATHLSFNPKHPYIAAPADHSLFLLLADIAATLDVPIDLHMEAVPTDMPLPHRFKSPPNPKRIKATIPALERLLSHNRGVKIIWVHLGWDSTGKRTAELSRQLFEKHPNLFMSIRVASEFHERTVHRRTFPLESGGRIKAEWLELIEDFPDRLLIGSDEFFMAPTHLRSRHGSTGSMRRTTAFLRQIPKPLARQIGYENARSLYRLDEQR